ncbi:MAG: PorV/PorQ family protein [Ignavibacteria bacterium]|nr:PorV/PorQ family protein [Ignavibacteria bacterium]
MSALRAGMLFILAISVPGSVAAQEKYQKLAQTGMKFLSVGVNARPSALADAFTAAEGSSESMFYNPAGMARMNLFADASVGQIEWIADILHNYGSVAVRPWNGDYGVFGLTFHYVDYGEIQATILANNAQGYLDAGTFRPSASALGLGYAIALSDRFSVGANVKLASQNLGSGYAEVSYVRGSGAQDSAFTGVREVKNSLDVYAFDLGVLYRTGYKSLTFGMSIRNFAKEVGFIKEKFQLPLTFRIGLAMNVLDVFEIDRTSQALTVVVDAEHPRDFPEQVKIGAEYLFLDRIALRVGYVTPADEHDLSFGLGVKQSMGGVKFALDYSYTPFGVFSSANFPSTTEGRLGLPTVSRLSLSFGFE